MYAILETGNQQYKVEEGARIKIEKIEGEIGNEVTFDKIYLVNDGEKVLVGTPVVENAKVTGEIIKQGRTRKVIVFKKKRRKSYRKKQGHRQFFTEIKIKNIAV